MYIFSDVIDLPCNFDYGEIHIIILAVFGPYFCKKIAKISRKLILNLTCLAERTNWLVGKIK